MDRLFGRRPAPPPNSLPHSQLQPAHSQQSRHSPGEQTSTRREMLRVVLRDTLQRHGVPAAWIVGQTFVATSLGREPGIHWRLQVKHWNPELLVHAVALQNNLIKHVMTFDPVAASWLMGVSWQFALEDESACPAMPHPGRWTAVQESARTPARTSHPEDSGGVIAGPVLIHGSAAAAKAESEGSSAQVDLHRMMAARDAELERHARSHETTQPMPLRTETEKP